MRISNSIDEYEYMQYTHNNNNSINISIIRNSAGLFVARYYVIIVIVMVMVITY